MAQFSLRMPDDLYEHLKSHAEGKNQSMNQAIIEMISEKLRDERWRNAIVKMRELRKMPPIQSDPAEIVRQMRQERTGHV